MWYAIWLLHLYNQHFQSPTTVFQLEKIIQLKSTVGRLTYLHTYASCKYIQNKISDAATNVRCIY